MDNGWGEWKHHVLHELERIAKSLDEISSRQRIMSEELASLKTKVGIWGAIAGFLAGVAVSVVKAFTLKS